MISKKIGYFLTLAENLSFTMTAQTYGVSQTAISQYIASLEERVGVRLFERNQHTVVLTEAGRYYYSRASMIAGLYEDTLSQVHNIDAGYQGSLKVGVGMYEYCSTERFFSSFLTQHPKIRVDILQFPYSVLTDQLRSGRLDIIIGDALCEQAFSARELESRTLFESPNYLVAHPDIAAKYEGQPLSAMLKNECLITNCEDGGPSSLQMLRKLLIDSFGFAPDAIAQTNSVNAQLMMVRALHGIAIVPGFVADVQGTDLVRFAMPGKIVAYRLMMLRSCPNKTAPLMFSFQA